MAHVPGGEHGAFVRPPLSTADWLRAEFSTADWLRIYSSTADWLRALSSTADWLRLELSTADWLRLEFLQIVHPLIFAVAGRATTTAPRTRVLVMLPNECLG